MHCRFSKVTVKRDKVGIQIDSLISRLYVVSDSDYKILLPFANLVASLAAFNSLFLRPTNPTSENPAYKLWGLAAIIFSSLQSFVSHKEQPHKDTAKTASEFETVLDTDTNRTGYRSVSIRSPILRITITAVLFSTLGARSTV